MLLGRNGAGKTTTLRTIMGLWPASQGRDHASAASRSRARPTPDIAAGGIAYVPESMGIFGDLTVRENMLLAARGARHVEQIDRARLDWIFGLFPALKTFWLYPAGKLSGGQKQMLAVARAIVEPRALLLIDEPSKGLAPSIIQNLITAFRELKSQQTTILLVEQNFMMATRAGRPGRGDGRRPRRARRHDGRAGRGRAHAAAPARAVAGSARMSTTSTSTAAATVRAPRVPTAAFDWIPLALVAGAGRGWRCRRSARRRPGSR